MTRRSVMLDGFSHGNNPIPAASRIGPLMASGAIFGVDRTTRTMPTDIEGQCANAFANMLAILASGGARAEDVLKITVYLQAGVDRAAVNNEWVRIFLDPGSRPARHTMTNPNLPAGQLIQLDFLAFIDAGDGRQSPGGLS